MRKTLIILFIFGWLYTDACTTFLINKNGQLVFGRNYDWVTGTGMVCINARGLAKTSMKAQEGQTITWISQYGSITFNQYGKEFPTGGMNEKGLVVELMWLDETRYPAPDTRPALGVLQWLQYQLDNCATVDELIANDAKVRIASVGTAPLHYLVADSSGKAATIEFLDGKMRVHTGKDLPFPVLTNSVYEQSASSFSLSAVVGKNSVRNGNNSLDRFIQACSMVSQYEQQDINTPVIDYSFSILDQVAQGSHTKWSIVYDISHKKILFKTYGFSQIKSVSFSSFDLDCKATAKIFDMNQAQEGDISQSFIDFTQDLNRQLVEKSLMESKREIRVSQETITATWQYPEGISCTGISPENHH